MASPSAVIQVYRNLLKTVSSTFRGDNQAVKALTQEARARFKAGKTITDPKKIRSELSEAIDAMEFIRDNIVQATKSSCGKYEVPADKARQLQEMAPEIVHPKNG